jgi:hypothetical protein
MERKKVGRPSKGDRSTVNCKLPVELHQAARNYAGAQGLTLTDLLGELLARELGMTYQTQEGLPLSEAS